MSCRLRGLHWISPIPAGVIEERVKISAIRVFGTFWTTLCGLSSFWVFMASQGKI